MTVPCAIARLDATDPEFAGHLDHLLSWESVSDESVNQRVLDIIKAVRERGTRPWSSLPSVSMVCRSLPWPTSSCRASVWSWP
jgi:hypothetical protein